MKLFREEHRRALGVFYGSDSEGLSSLLQGLGGALEVQVLPESAGFDSAAGGIDPARKVLFEQGVCRIPFPGYGGLSLPFGAYSMAMELAAAADAPTAMSVAIHNAVAEGIFRFGSDAQKEQRLPKLMAGGMLASFSLTEPSSGSDAASMSTVAVRTGSGYTINGTKTFITNAGDADLYLVFAKTGDGHSALLVDRSTPGLSFGPDIPKLGMRGSRTSEVRLQDCRVPLENLVGTEGGALEYVKAMLNSSRIVMGAICVGIASVAFSKALEYSTQRSVGGKRLSDMPVTRERVADMRSEITSARSMYLFASRLKEMGQDYASEAAQAKVLATEMSTRVCDRAIQLFGGYGYTNGDIHRHWRDARLLTIGEGASEVLRMLIASKELNSLG